jgi:hypothetical protein
LWLSNAETAVPQFELGLDSTMPAISKSEKKLKQVQRRAQAYNFNLAVHRLTVAYGPCTAESSTG